MSNTPSRRADSWRSQPHNYDLVSSSDAGRVQDILTQQLQKLRAEYTQLQQHYKQASLDLMQARLVVKNIGDASSADAALLAAADAGGAAAHTTALSPLTEAVAAAAAGGATSGSVTPPVRPVSEAAPSAADARSSASSYLPVGLAAALSGGTQRHGGAALSSTMQLSAQLANAHVKVKIEQQRADAAEAQVRQLQQQLGVDAGGPAAGGNEASVRDKPTGVLQVRPTPLFRQLGMLLPLRHV